MSMFHVHIHHLMDRMWVIQNYKNNQYFIQIIDDHDEIFVRSLINSPKLQFKGTFLN